MCVYVRERENGYHCLIWKLVINMSLWFNLCLVELFSHTSLFDLFKAQSLARRFFLTSYLKMYCTTKSNLCILKVLWDPMLANTISRCCHGKDKRGISREANVIVSHQANHLKFLWTFAFFSLIESSVHKKQVNQQTCVMCLMIRSPILFCVLLITFLSGAFLVPYVLFLLACGIPMFLLETAMGQFTSQGCITCWRHFCPLFEGQCVKQNGIM